MQIRKAENNDIERLLDLYEQAKVRMRASGNPHQWGDDYPSREIIKHDIDLKQSYVLLTEQGEICGVFVFIIGDEPTYARIEDGAWLNDARYGVIHRAASDGIHKGVMHQVLDYCTRSIGNIRIDTHEDNKAMQHLLKKEGFERCGIIYVEDGTPRIAFQRRISE